MRRTPQWWRWALFAAGVFSVTSSAEILPAWLLIVYFGSVGTELLKDYLRGTAPATLAEKDGF